MFSYILIYILGPLKAACLPPDDTKCFEQIPKPKRGDWLADHKEVPQSFKSYGRKVFKAQPHATYTTVYLVPVGSFDHPRAPDLEVNIYIYIFSLSLSLALYIYIYIFICMCVHEKGFII